MTQKQKPIGVYTSVLKCMFWQIRIWLKGITFVQSWILYFPILELSLISTLILSLNNDDIYFLYWVNGNTSLIQNTWKDY